METYKAEYSKLLKPDIVLLLSKIREQKGWHTMLMRWKEEYFDSLTMTAKQNSVEAFARMSDIRTSESRMKKIIWDKTIPKETDERKIAGYRDTLNRIQKSYRYLSLSVPEIHQLYQDLNRYNGMAVNRRFRSSEIPSFNEGSNPVTGYAAPPAKEIPAAIENMCTFYAAAVNDPEVDELLLIPVVMVDFQCIQPFEIGNESMSILIMQLLLLQAGFTVGKYISFDQLLADTKTEYDQALLESCAGWSDGHNDYLPFVKYILTIILKAYREFAEKAEILALQHTSKPDRVYSVIKEKTGRITKSEIMEKCPDISQITVQRTLADLLSNGSISKIGGGRYTSYVWNGEGK
ncbi:MAG: Fic family protein [Solobacterium sp.]|nr:Fic family protein [Solobacterium sp.]